MLSLGSLISLLCMGADVRRGQDMSTANQLCQIVPSTCQPARPPSLPLPPSVSCSPLAIHVAISMTFCQWCMCVWCIYCVVYVCVTHPCYKQRCSCMHDECTTVVIIAAGPPNQAYHNAGSLNLATANLLQAQQQGIFSPTTTVITHSPVQILGAL